MILEEEILVENRNQVSIFVRVSVLDLEIGNLWFAKVVIIGLWIGLNKSVVFYGSNWVV